MHQKKTSCGLQASANRWRLIFFAGRYCTARSSLMTCNRSRLVPLIGTETKQSSGDQYPSSDGCNRVQSPTSPIFGIGNAVSSVSTPLIVGAFFDLNFSEKLCGFLIWITDASDLSLLGRSPLLNSNFRRRSRLRLGA